MYQATHATGYSIDLCLRDQITKSWQQRSRVATRKHTAYVAILHMHWLSWPTSANQPVDRSYAILRGSTMMSRSGLQICLRLHVTLTLAFCITAVVTRWSLTVKCHCHVWLKTHRTVLDKSHQKGFLWPSLSRVQLIVSCPVDHFCQSASKSANLFLKHHVRMFGNGQPEDTTPTSAGTVWPGRGIKYAQNFAI